MTAPTLEERYLKIIELHLNIAYGLAEMFGSGAVDDKQLAVLLYLNENVAAQMLGTFMDSLSDEDAVELVNKIQDLGFSKMGEALVGEIEDFLEG